MQDVANRKGAGIVNRYYGGSLIRALMKIYPEHPWDPTRVGRFEKAELLLHKMVQDIFPNTTVVMNYNHPHLQYARTKGKMQFGIVINSGFCEAKAIENSFRNFQLLWLHKNRC